MMINEKTKNERKKMQENLEVIANQIAEYKIDNEILIQGFKIYVYKYGIDDWSRNFRQDYVDYFVKIEK